MKGYKAWIWHIATQRQKLNKGLFSVYGGRQFINITSLLIHKTR